MRLTLFITGCMLAAHSMAQNAAPQVQLATTDITCAGQKDGRLELTLLSGTLPVDFQWINLNNGAQGTGQFIAANKPILLTALDGGLYRFTFNAADGVDTTVQRTIVEPLPLLGKLFIQTNSFGFQLACAGSQDGTVLCQASGGTAPLIFQWSNGDQGVRADSLSAGAVAVTVSDARGCTLQVDTTLTAPPPILAEVTVAGETCFGQNSGEITVQSVSGGVPPFQYALNGDTPGSLMSWTDLPHGPYFLSVIDAGGCVHQEGVILPSGLEFTLKLGADTSMRTGDTLRLTLQIDPPADTLFWSPGTSVRMLNAEEVLLFPAVSTIYQVTALSADGCVATDEIRVTVNRDRDIYLPNAFAPNAQDAANQSFTVYGSGGIRTVDLLRVYDRFGRLWFENRNFPVNDPASGWRGSDGRDEAPPGVYLWRVVLHYTDGREVLMTGDVTVVR